MARQLRCIFWHPSTRAVNSAVKKCTRVHGPSTRAVNSVSVVDAAVAVWRIHQHHADNKDAGWQRVYDYDEEEHKEDGHNAILDRSPRRLAYWSAEVSSSIRWETAELYEGMIQWLAGTEKGLVWLIGA